MEGFQSATESGVRKAFTSAAKIAAGAFAIKETFDFGKEIVQHAADVQKQVEAIKGVFGAASDEVLKFSENGAAALNISAHLADTTSVKFGILFKNLGVGPEAAAKMTIGFESLAGSIAKIRGIDPATVLQNLPLAAAGNIRSLKQLGIATDQNQIKLAAFKLGLTQSVTQGLTPAQRAIAIYAIATKNLDALQAQAALHSGDLIDQERHLAVVWDNAKDKLGAGLLPAVTKLVTLLSIVVPPAISATTTAFQDMRMTIEGIGKFLAPAFKPILDIADRIRSAFQGGGGSGIAQLREEFVKLGPVAKVAAIAVGIYAASVIRAAAASAILFALESPLIATFAAIAALSVAFAEAYKHSARFRDEVDRLKAFLTGTLVPALASLNQKISPAIQAVFDTYVRVFEAIKSKAVSVAPTVGHALLTAFDALKAAAPVVGRALVTAFDAIRSAVKAAIPVAVAAFGDLREGIRRALPVFDQIGTTISKAFNLARVVVTRWVQVMKVEIGVGLLAVIFIWQHFGDTIKKIVSNTFDAVLGVVKAAFKIIGGVFDVFDGLLTLNFGKVWGGLKDIAKGGLDLVTSSVEGWGKDIAAVFEGIWDNIKLLAAKGLDSILGLIAKIPTKIPIPVITRGGPGIKWIGVENPAKAGQEWMKQYIASFAKAAKEADIAKQVQSATSALQERNPRPTTSAAAAAVAGTFADTFSKKVADVVTPKVRDATASAVNTGLSDGAGNGANAAANSGLTTVKQALAALGVRLREAIAKMATDIKTAVADAKQNLDQIGSTLASSIGTLIDQPITLAERAYAVVDAKLQGTQDRLNLRSLALQATSNKLALQSAVLQGVSDKLNRTDLDIQRAQGKRDLSKLTQSVLLPGGKRLSDNPQTALAQLRALAATSHNNPVLQDFILKFREAVSTTQKNDVAIKQAANQAAQNKVAIKQAALQIETGKVSFKQALQGIKESGLAAKRARAEVLKETVTREISDLADSFNRGLLGKGLAGYKKFRAEVMKILHQFRPQLNTSGKTLGTAFANGFNDTGRGFLAQGLASALGPQRPGITGQNPRIVRPELTVQADLRAIKKIQTDIGNKQVTIQDKIAKQSKKAADLLAKIHATQVNPDAKSLAKNPGNQSAISRALNRASG